MVSIQMLGAFGGNMSKHMYPVESSSTDGVFFAVLRYQVALMLGTGKLYKATSGIVLTQKQIYL